MLRRSGGEHQCARVCCDALRVCCVYAGGWRTCMHAFCLFFFCPFLSRSVRPLLAPCALAACLSLSVSPLSSPSLSFVLCLSSGCSSLRFLSASFSPWLLVSFSRSTVMYLDTCCLLLLLWTGSCVAFALLLSLFFFSFFFSFSSSSSSSFSSSSSPPPSSSPSFFFYLASAVQI